MASSTEGYLHARHVTVGLCSCRLEGISSPSSSWTCRLRHTSTQPQSTSSKRSSRRTQKGAPLLLPYTLFTSPAFRIKSRSPLSLPLHAFLTIVSTIAGSNQLLATRGKSVGPWSGVAPQSFACVNGSDNENEMWNAGASLSCWQIPASSFRPPCSERACWKAWWALTACLSAPAMLSALRRTR